MTIYITMILIIAAYRYLLGKIEAKVLYGFLCYIGAVLPLSLIMVGAIVKDAGTIVISGFCMIYFSFIMIKPDKK